MTYHLLNEIIENDQHQDDNTDAIADLYIFDLGGILLFSFDPVKQFFAETLHMADWSPQPSFVLTDASLYNHGHFFSFKWSPFTQLEKWSAFWYVGMGALWGVSYRWEDQTSLSLAGGLRASSLEVLDAGKFRQTVRLSWSAGIFYDKFNTPTLSFTIARLNDRNAFTLNIYPGIFHIGSFSFGAWTEVRDDRYFLIGLTTKWAPGVALKTVAFDGSIHEN